MDSSLCRQYVLNLIETGVQSYFTQIFSEALKSAAAVLGSACCLCPNTAASALIRQQSDRESASCLLSTSLLNHTLT